MTRAHTLRTPRRLAHLCPAILSLAVLAGTAGCASERSYPSLSLRPAERVAGTMTPVDPDAAPPPPTAQPPVDGALGTRLAALVDKARTADRGFATLRAQAEQAIAAGGSGDSSGKPWLSAQVALSQLQVGRSGTMSALAELDTLYANARDAQPLDETPEIAAIAAARNEVQAIVASEDTALDSLASRIRG